MTFATAAIDLAAAIIRDHERSSAGAVTVIPVVVEDVLLAMPVLHAVRDLTKATWLDSADLNGPVPVSTDIRRQGLLDRGLELGPTERPRRLELSDKGGGTIEPVFVPASGTVPSPGDGTILSVFRAVAHSALDENSIGIVVYRESVLDVHTRRAAWRATIEWFLNLPNPRLRTLVVVVEAPIDVSLHCRTGLGFRYALSGGRLLRRRGEDDLRAFAQQVGSLSGPTVLFLGAGFSASSRLPLGNGLRDGAIRRLLGIAEPDAFSSLELAIRFHAWVTDRPTLMSHVEREQTQSEYADRLTLEQVVRAEVNFTGGPSQTLTEFKAHHDRVVSTPGPAVRDLARILETGGGRIILTGVNFDCLVEENTKSPIRVFASDDEFQDAAGYVSSYLSGKETEIPYLKLHGSIDRMDTCVMSAEQTERGIGESKLQALRALQHEPPRMWIYVGASMRDLDLAPVLSEENFARGIDERWVAPYLVDTVDAFAFRRQPYWEKTSFKTIQDRLITETADAFFDALAAAWRSV